MPDNLNIRQPQDRKEINVNEPWELASWTRELRCTEKELRDAVKAVGPWADAVKKHLGR